MVFRSGKYQGYTIEEVTRIAPWYIRWVKENRPEGLLMMMECTLLGYGVIHIVLSIRKKFKS